MSFDNGSVNKVTYYYYNYYYYTRSFANPYLIVYTSLLLIPSLLHLFLTLYAVFKSMSSLFKFYNKVGDSLNLELWTPTIVLTFPTVYFTVTAFLWYWEYRYCDSLETYLQITSLVQLFGLMCSLYLSLTCKYLLVFSVTIVQVIIHDIIASFLPLFSLVWIGFSLAMHCLQLETFPNSSTVEKSVFKVFGSLFRIASIDTISLFKEQAILLRTLLAFFIPLSTIVMFNIIITMVNKRYKSARILALTMWKNFILIYFPRRSLCFERRNKVKLETMNNEQEYIYAYVKT